jgi:hypothetical protein
MTRYHTFDPYTYWHHVEAEGDRRSPGAGDSDTEECLDDGKGNNANNEERRENDRDRADAGGPELCDVDVEPKTSERHEE